MDQQIATSAPIASGEPSGLFRKALVQAINCHSMENGSDSPDFLLAQYLIDCLSAFDKATKHREAYYGRLVSEPGGQFVKPQ